MADYLTTTEELTLVANAIRNKCGISKAMVYPHEFVSEIDGIEINPIAVTVNNASVSLISGTTDDYLLTMN